MAFFQVAQDVLDLLSNHLPPILLILIRCPEPPQVDPVRGVCPLTPFQMAPKVAVVIYIVQNMVFHILQAHLQREINSTDLSDVIST